MKLISRISFLAIAFVAFSFTSVNAQKAKTLKEGHIKYTLSKIVPDSPEMAMLSGSEMSFYFTKEMTRMHSSFMGGMVEIGTVIENGTKEGYMLANMMGATKAKVKMTKEAMEKQAAQTPKFDITYDKSDTKEVAGYPCYRANLTNKADKSVTVIYVTEKLKTKVNFMDKMFPGIEGLPLEFVINAPNGMSMYFSAEEVNTKLEKDAFDIPEDYKEMTMKEFEEAMGGLSGLGF